MSISPQQSRASRRRFNCQLAAFGFTSSIFASRSANALIPSEAADDPAQLPLPNQLIIDTHQHLWNLTRTSPPWLEGAGEVLRQTYETEAYRAATAGLNIQAIYMEVDVAPQDHVAEAKHIVQLTKDPQSFTRAAVIGGRPADAQFEAYLDQVAVKPQVKGVRQVLHGESTPQGYCLQPDFVRGIRALGKRQLKFDLCMRPGELNDALKLVSLVPETDFVLDHCGNADPQAFAPNAAEKSHNPDEWRKAIEALAGKPNVTCKISGIVARAPKNWQAELLAPVVNHCLDSFGPDRVVFGSDWPVCLLGAPLRDWVAALHHIIQSRPAADQKKLWSANAQRIYQLNT